MRLAEIAKELRITTQELRHELLKTNFGVSATAHEVDDALGKGILRFLKGKVKPTLTHRRTAVVFKDEKEITAELGGEMKAPPVEDSKKKKGKLKAAEIGLKAPPPPPPEPEPVKPVAPPMIDRSIVPKNTPFVSARDNAGVNVSRRIELGTPRPATPARPGELPKNYYKAGKKKHKGPRHAEDMVLETMQRHPHTGPKSQVAKVKYEVGEADDLTIEELNIEKETDRDMFRAQKKGRALSTRRGPKAQPQIKAKVGVVEIPSIISLKEFAEKCGLPVSDVISTLMKNGMIATINQKLDYDTAEIVATELHVEIKKQATEATSEELFEGDLKKILESEDKKLLAPRAPIISVMGHVDHGKTKLLDYIRKTNIVAGEAGGITQHIGAYQVVKNGHPITFLDTPGHEAFTAMRARGAKATDIAILVVAADEGVKPQTIEAIHHAQEAGIPIIVAINKMDRPNANPEKVKAELVEHGLQAEEWGGKTIMVPVSAFTGEGMDKLLEMILLVAEVEQLKANPNRLAVGTVIESHLDKSLGPVGTILINTGTLHLGDNIVVGSHVGRVKAMHDYLGKNIKEAPPSTPVQLSGLEKVPAAGDLLQVYKSEKIAKEHATKLEELMRSREEQLSGSMVERLVSQISSGQIKFLKLVLKADTKGSLEAITQALAKVKSETVANKIIHFGVGNITDTDVIMAAASQALLIGFHVEVGPHVRRLAEKEHVDIKSYTIIYKLIEDIKAILAGMLEPEIRVVELGKLELKSIFLNKKKWVIAGATVTQGVVQKNAMVRITRKGETLFETKLDSLRFVKEEISELEKGSDCGLKFDTPKPVEPGDILEAYKVERIERKF